MPPAPPLPWLRFSKYSGERVLVVTAHPDDADWYCGGAAKKLSEAGAEVIYVICTDGGGGSMDASLTRSKLAEIRKIEQRTANDILGVSKTIHLGHPDGGLNKITGLDSEISALIRDIKPALFITFDPAHPEHSMHPDHRAACLAALRAVRFSVLPLCFTDEQPVEPHTCKEILLFGPKRPDVWVPVNDVSFSKLLALHAHESQMAHMLDDNAKKLMAWVLKRGDTLDTRLLLSAFSPLFRFETFRRMNRMELLR